MERYLDCGNPRYGFACFLARATSHIPDKGQIMVRYYGLYANAYGGKVKKASMITESGSLSPL